MLAADGHGERVLAVVPQRQIPGCESYDAASGKVLASSPERTRKRLARPSTAPAGGLCAGGSDGAMAMWDAVSGRSVAKMPATKAVFGRWR